MIYRRVHRNKDVADKICTISADKSVKQKLVLLSLPLTLLSILSALIIVIVLSLNIKNVPEIPDDPAISVDSGQQLQLEQLFNKKLSEFNIGIEQARTALYWSPDDNYIIFEGLATSESYGIKSTAAMASIRDNQIFKIREGDIISIPSWNPEGTSVAISFEDGLFIYDVASSTIKKIEDKVYMPRFSPDGTKIAYYNDGIYVYDISENKSTRIADKKYYAAPQWFSDGESILAFREDEINQNGRIQNQQVLARIDINSADKPTDIISMRKKRLNDATWLQADGILYITSNANSGKSYYIADLNSKTVLTLGEISSGVSEREIYVDKKSAKIMQADNGTIQVFDYGMKMIDSFDIQGVQGSLSYKENQDYSMLSNGRVVFRNANAYGMTSAIMIAEPSTNLIFKIVDYGEISKPRVSNNGDKIAVIIAGGRRLKIINAAEATGEVVPSVLITIGSQKDNNLLKLFPHEAGIEWLYEGSFGYSHTLKLDQIIKDENNDSTEYLLSGKVSDLSNRISEDSLKVNIKYRITQNAIREIVDSQPLFPHKIKEFDIIRGPVVEGNEWIEEVVFEGKAKQLKAEIMNVTENEDTEERQITVSYTILWDEIPDGFYKENRVIKTGRGIETFNNTYDKYTKKDYKIKQINIPNPESDDEQKMPDIIN